MYILKKKAPSETNSKKVSDVKISKKLVITE